MQVYSCSLTLQLKLEVNHILLSCIQFEPEYMIYVYSSIKLSHVIYVAYNSSLEISHSCLFCCFYLLLFFFLQWNDVYNGVHSF